MGKYSDKNNQKLKSISDEEWVLAIHKCREVTKFRIRGRTKFGAHTEFALGEKAEEYYTNIAILAILEGTWEFKDKFTLEEQLIRIALKKKSDNEQKQKNKRNIPLKEVYLDEDSSLLDLFYIEELEFDELELEEKANMERQFLIIEEIAQSKAEYSEYFECVCEQLKPKEIAIIMNMDIKEVYRLTENFKNYVRNEIKRRRYEQ